MRSKMGRLPPGMARASKMLISIGVLSLVFCAGVYLCPVASESQMTTVIRPTVECQLVESHTVQYVDRPVTVVNNVERVQEIPVELRNFNGLDELRQWLAEVAMNTTTIFFQRPDAPVDCDDYAVDLQRKALTDGYILSFQIISRSEYNAVFQGELPPGQGLHAVNLAIIGNNGYYIEPQTGEIAFAIYLD